MSFISYYNEDSTQIEVDNINRVGTGVISGGVLSINTDTTKFNISAGEGVFLDLTNNEQTNLTWTTKTALTATYRTTNLISYIGIDTNGAVIQRATKFTPTERRLYINLGVLVHTSLTVIDAVNNLQYPLINVVNQLHDVMDVLGIINVSGNIFSVYTTDLRMSKSAGSLFQTGSNYSSSLYEPHTKTLSALSPLVFQYRLSNSVNYTGLAQSTIIPGLYESSSGVTTALTASYPFSIQRIYSFVSNNVKLQFGQAVYKTMADAQAAMNTEIFLTEPSILLNGCFRAFLVVERLATNLSLSTSAYFFNVGKFGSSSPGAVGGTTTMQQAYDNTGTLTHITTTLTGGPVEIQKGLEVGTSDDLILFKNSAGTEVVTIDALGNLDCITVNGVTPITIYGNGLINTANTLDVDYNTTNLKITTAQINTIQNISTTSSPTFNNLICTTVNSVIPITVYGNGLINTTNTLNIDYNATNLKITAAQINTIQDITTTSAVTFGNLICSEGYMQLNATGSNTAYIDFSTFNGDYDLRIQREDAANGHVNIENRGTGNIYIKPNQVTTITISTGTTLFGNDILMASSKKIDFTNYTVASAVTPSHINLWGDVYGFSMLAGTLAYLTGDGSTHQFFCGGGLYFNISSVVDRLICSFSIVPEKTNNVQECGISTLAWAQTYSYGYTDLSDGRIKENIETCNTGLDFIIKLNPKTYTWVDTETKRIRRHIGLIAQDVADVIYENNENLNNCDIVGNEYLKNKTETEACRDEKRAENDIYTIKYNALFCVMVNAIKELTTENDLLKDRLNVIEKLLNISN